MARVLVTEPVIDAPLEHLQSHHDVTVGERGHFSDEQALIDAIPGYDALLCALSVPVTQAVIEAADRLQVIANYAVGYDNIDVEAATEQGIRVANTPDVLTESSADGAFALLMATARKVVTAEQFLRDDKFDGWHPKTFLGMELFGKTLGIIGMGNIGSGVARRAAGFGMKVCYHNRNPLPAEKEKRLHATYCEELDELLTQSDIISVHCPLTDQTHHLLDRRRLELIPEHAIVINTARGAIIDEEALAEQLHRGGIAAAGLDVFEEEPKIHPKLLSAPNATLLPHVASATLEARTKMGFLAVNAIIAILEGKPEHSIPNLIEP